MIKLSNIISINNPSDIAVPHYVLQQGIACKIGQLTLNMDVVLVDHWGTNHPVHVEALAFWPDQSIRWLQINAVLPLAANTVHTYSLHQSVNNVTPSPAFCEIKTNNNLQVHCANHVVQISHQGISQEHWTLDFSLLFAEVERTRFTVKSIKEYHTHVPLFCDIQCTIHAFSGQQQISNELTIRIVHANADLFIETVLHNPSPAHHPDGTWDLGDPNSVFIDQWQCQLNGLAENSVITTQLQPETAYINSSQLYVEQLSSGGAHWDSDAHIDESLSSPICHAKALINDSESNLSRAEPTVHIALPDGEWFYQLTYFWQKFPSTLRLSTANQHKQITWGLHSSAIAPLNELQPGERWQRKLLLTQAPCTVMTNINVSLAPAYLSKTGAIELFHEQQQHSPLHSLLAQGLTGDANYFNKREQADMFGFRHFGEIYADHEAVEHQGNKAFISFYNNQYDPLLGLLKQGLLTQDSRYMQLAQDLAEHIVHIDIYHTQRDKPEYNGGLFWHTDHYLPALSSTHRTYSSHHQANAYEDHAGGGGPGGQHCYTSGLLYYYYLTGNHYAKEAVVSLYRWIEQVYDGDQSLVSLLLALKNRHRVDLKNIMTDTYPLDRGTANYINATLDMYLLEHDQYYLHKAFAIIAHTVDSNEDLSKRQLDDVERHWFYTVFVQAICRFMRIASTFPAHSKEHQLWLHCQQLVIKFADWMVEHESPYLSKPDELEYPNQTWSGQDLRKVDILSFAAYITPIKQRIYQQKATQLEQYILAQLTDSQETQFSRVQALIMQNYGGEVLYQAINTQYPIHINSTINHRNEGCQLRPTALNKKSSLQQIALNNLQNWSIKHEITQLKKRSQRLNKWMN